MVRKEIIKSDEVTSDVKKGVYWSQAVRVGNLLFLAGAGPEDKDRNIIGVGDFAKQANQAFKNIASVLAKVRATMSDVVKITGYLVRREDFPKYNEIRRKFFKKDFPASTTVIVKSLAREEYLLEVDAIAVVPNK